MLPRLVSLSPIRSCAMSLTPVTLLDLPRCPLPSSLVHSHSTISTTSLPLPPHTLLYSNTFIFTFFPRPAWHKARQPETTGGFVTMGGWGEGLTGWLLNTRGVVMTFNKHGE